MVPSCGDLESRVRASKSDEVGHGSGTLGIPALSLLGLVSIFCRAGKQRLRMVPRPLLLWVISVAKELRFLIVSEQRGARSLSEPGHPPSR